MMNRSKIGIKTGIIIAVIIHVSVYILVVHPMNTAHGDNALGYVLPSMILYFPASLLAWGLAMGTSSTQAYTGTMLIVGGLWYVLIGFWIGRKMHRKKNQY